MPVVQFQIFIVNMAPTQKSIILYTCQADLETSALMIALDFFYCRAAKNKTLVLQQRANTESGSVDQSETN